MVLVGTLMCFRSKDTTRNRLLSEVSAGKYNVISGININFAEAAQRYFKAYRSNICQSYLAIGLRWELP